jgi:hypothetical protein
MLLARGAVAARPRDAAVNRTVLRGAQHAQPVGAHGPTPALERGGGRRLRVGTWGGPCVLSRVEGLRGARTTANCPHREVACRQAALHGPANTYPTALACCRVMRWAVTAYAGTLLHNRSAMSTEMGLIGVDRRGTVSPQRPMRFLSLCRSLSHTHTVPLTAPPSRSQARRVLRRIGSVRCAASSSGGEGRDRDETKRAAAELLAQRAALQGGTVQPAPVTRLAMETEKPQQRTTSRQVEQSAGGSIRQVRG